MSSHALAYAIGKTGITPHMKLLLVLMADDIDVDGCYPSFALPELQQAACLSKAQFEYAFARLMKAERAYEARDELGNPATYWPNMQTSKRPVAALEDDAA